MDPFSFLIPILLYAAGPLFYVRNRKEPVTTDAFRRFCIFYFLGTYIALSALTYVVAGVNNSPGFFLFILIYFIFKRILVDKNLLIEGGTTKDTSKASATQTQSSYDKSDYTPTDDPIYDTLEEDFDPFDQNNFQRPADDFYDVRFDEEADSYSYNDFNKQNQSDNRYSSLELEEEFGLFGKKNKGGKKGGVAWVVVIIFALGILMYSQFSYWTVSPVLTDEEHTEAVTEIEEVEENELDGTHFGNHSVEWYVLELNQEAISLGLDEDYLLTYYTEDTIDDFVMYNFTFSTDSSVTLYYDLINDNYSIAIFESNFDGTLSKPTKLYCKALFSLLEPTQDSEAEDFLAALDGTISAKSEYVGSEAGYYINPSNELFSFLAHLF